MVSLSAVVLAFFNAWLPEGAAREAPKADFLPSATTAWTKLGCLLGLFDRLLVESGLENRFGSFLLFLIYSLEFGVDLVPLGPVRHRESRHLALTVWNVALYKGFPQLRVFVGNVGRVLFDFAKLAWCLDLLEDRSHQAVWVVTDSVEVVDIAYDGASRQFE